jgi:chemotaxis regulatin CheY-phosphate phosphatase CheZ
MYFVRITRLGWFRVGGTVTDFYRNCLLPVVIQMTEDDLQRVLESIERLKRSGAMEADELAHIERVTEQWIEFFRNSLNKAPA